MKIVGTFRLIQSTSLLVMVTMIAGCSGSSTSVTPASRPDAVFTKERAPKTLPEVGDGVRVSEDRRTMDALVARAEKEGKTIVLDVTAAWCPPCQSFAKDLAAHPEFLKELSEKNLILAKVEYEKAPTTPFFDLNDYLPIYTQFFPSFHSYVPGKGWKLMGSADSVKDLRQLVEKLVPQESLGVAELKAEAEKAARLQEQDPKVELAGAAMMSMYGAPYTYTYGETRELIRSFESLKQRYPKSSADSWAGSLKRELLQYIGSGAITLEGLAQDFPDLGTKLRDVSQIKSLLPFVYKLADQLHKDGLKTAADDCETTWTEYKSELVRGALSDADYQTKMGELNHQAIEICSGLELRANGTSDELKAKMKALPADKLGDWALLAGLDDVDRAVELFEKRYKMFTDYYEKREKSNAEELQKAKDAKDEAKEKSANEKIETLKFQREYHQSVVDTVKAELRAKAPVTTISVLN